MTNDYMRGFRDEMRRQFIAITMDDVLIRPGISDVHPADVELTARLTRRFTSKNLWLASAMDTVMNARAGIALAKAGCVGIMHRALPAEEQAEQIARVRLASGFVPKPKTELCTRTIGELLDRIAQREAEGKNVFHTFPITDEHEHVVGLVTGRDLRRYRNQRDRPLREIMIKFDDLVKERPGTGAKEAYALLNEQNKSVLMLLDDDRKLHGLYLFDELQTAFEESNAGHNVDDENRFLVGAAVGVGKQELLRAEMLVAKGCRILVIDSAHGHSEGVITMLRECKKLFRDTDVIAGNVATYEGALALCEAGADAIKVGIGPGSICTTRIVAGAGVPQITAIMEARAAAEKSDTPVIGDGGIRNSGDAVKVIAAGADIAMIGSLLAGTDESPGAIKIVGGLEVKDYRGMGSAGAMAASAASRERYRQDKAKFVPEGVEGMVRYRGPISRVIDELTGGVKSGFGYAGARTIRDLHERAQFIRITPSGLRESHPHDIMTGDSAI